MDIRRYIVLTAIAVTLAGCAAKPVIPPQPVSLTGVNKVRAMTVAEDVLTDLHFTIEKADAQKGYLVTKPLRGGQIFEVWRRDNASAVASLESAMHSLQRTARIYITEDASGIRIDCSVSVRRLSLPENDHVTQLRAAGMFTSSSHRLQRLEVSPEQAERMEWIDLGPDPDLEKKILRLIRKKLSAYED